MTTASPTNPWIAAKDLAVNTFQWLPPLVESPGDYPQSITLASSPFDSTFNDHLRTSLVGAVLQTFLASSTASVSDYPQSITSVPASASSSIASAIAFLSSLQSSSAMASTTASDAVDVDYEAEEESGPPPLESTADPKPSVTVVGVSTSEPSAVQVPVEPAAPSTAAAASAPSPPPPPPPAHPATKPPKPVASIKNVPRPAVPPPPTSTQQNGGSSNTLEEAVKLITSDVGRYRAEQRGAKVALSDVEGDVRDLKKDVSGLKAEVKKFTAPAANVLELLEKNVLSLNSRAGKLEVDAADLSRLLDKRTADIEAVERNLVDATTSSVAGLESVKGCIELLKKADADTDHTIAELRQTVDAVNSRMEAAIAAEAKAVQREMETSAVNTFEGRFVALEGVVGSRMLEVEGRQRVHEAAVNLSLRPLPDLAARIEALEKLVSVLGEWKSDLASRDLTFGLLLSTVSSLAMRVMTLEVASAASAVASAAPPPPPQSRVSPARPALPPPPPPPPPLISPAAPAAAAAEVEAETSAAAVSDFAVDLVVDGVTLKEELLQWCDNSCAIDVAIELLRGLFHSTDGQPGGFRHSLQKKQLGAFVEYADLQRESKTKSRAAIDKEIRDEFCALMYASGQYVNEPKVDGRFHAMDKLVLGILGWADAYHIVARKRVPALLHVVSELERLSRRGDEPRLTMQDVVDEYFTGNTRPGFEQVHPPPIIAFEFATTLGQGETAKHARGALDRVDWSKSARVQVQILSQKYFFRLESVVMRSITGSATSTAAAAASPSASDAGHYAAQIYLKPRLSPAGFYAYDSYAHRHSPVPYLGPNAVAVPGYEAAFAVYVLEPVVDNARPNRPGPRASSTPVQYSPRSAALLLPSPSQPSAHPLTPIAIAASLSASVPPPPPPPPPPSASSSSRMLTSMSRPRKRKAASAEEGSE